MPTNEERLAVASAMREEAQKWEDVSEKGWYYNLKDADTLMQDLVHFAGIDGRVKPSKLFSRFADLIEPEQERTCRMKYNKRTCRVYCSHCGERMDIYTYYRYDDGTYGYRYPYCYECGAKVINGVKRL